MSLPQVDKIYKDVFWAEVQHDYWTTRAWLRYQTQSAYSLDSFKRIVPTPGRARKLAAGNMVWSTPSSAQGKEPTAWLAMKDSKPTWDHDQQVRASIYLGDWETPGRYEGGEW